MNELISLEKIAQWQKLKTLVLDSVSTPKWGRRMIVFLLSPSGKFSKDSARLEIPMSLEVTCSR